jgi:rubrerythrin
MAKEKKLLKFKSVDEVLDFAIREEEEAYAFYKGWKEKLTQPGSQKVFDELAKEELKHKVLLTDVKTGKKFQSASEKITDLKIAETVADAHASPDSDYQDALIISMKKEKEAFMLYSDLAALTTDDEIQALFRTLAQEEAKHKMKLEILYDEDVLKEN